MQEGRGTVRNPSKKQNFVRLIHQEKRECRETDTKETGKVISLNDKGQVRVHGVSRKMGGNSMPQCGEERRLDRKSWSPFRTKKSGSHPGGSRRNRRRRGKRLLKGKSEAKGRNNSGPNDNRVLSGMGDEKKSDSQRVLSPSRGMVDPHPRGEHLPSTHGGKRGRA